MTTLQSIISIIIVLTIIKILWNEYQIDKTDFQDFDRYGEEFMYF